MRLAWGSMDGRRMTWVCIELLVLWLGLPILLWLETLPPTLRIGILAAAAVYGLWIVRRERVPWNRLGFRGRHFLLASLRSGLPWVAASWPMLMALMALTPGGARSEMPEGWSLGEALAYYALISVTSQEFLYSSFFFWRYRPLFSPGFLAGLNSVVFAVAHLVYGSWLSLGLAFAGRLVLARVYRRYESFWGVWILHLLLGLAVFAAGLGGYFQRPLRP
jgi:uncharacterized protein